MEIIPSQELKECADITVRVMVELVMIPKSGNTLSFSAPHSTYSPALQVGPA